MNTVQPEQTEQNEVDFSEFLNKNQVDWNASTLSEKEHELHEFLNMECGAGVFTDPVSATGIKVEFDQFKKIVIDTSVELTAIDQQINDFFKVI